MKNEEIECNCQYQLRKDLNELGAVFPENHDFDCLIKDLQDITKEVEDK